MHTLKRLLAVALGTRAPITEGTIRLAGIRSKILVRRDAHGIPYVEAENDDDAFFGAGFCQTQDRGFQMELYLRVARGTLAEVFGDEMLPVDRLMRRLGFVGIARRQLPLLAPRERAQLESFARGVNTATKLGAEKRPHELTLLGAKASTFDPLDIIAVLQFFAFALSSNWDAELARLRILRSDGVDALLALEASDPAWTRGLGDLGSLAEDSGSLAAAERLADEASRLARLVGLGGASNAWAVAPSRTASGRAILACDPHLAPTLPSPWYLLHVRTPTWAMSGGFLPGNPIPTFGHNENVAWAITAGHVDNTDLFLERVGPDEKSVLEGSSWTRCEVREEVIAVKGKKSTTERVLVTPRGPIVSPALGGDPIALSLRATWMAPRKIGGYDIYTVKTVEEAGALYASYPAISENRVFADTAGSIAWHVVGDVPVRKKGVGLLPAPGWDASFGWENEPLPWSALPQSIDPEEGFVASANQHPGPSPTGAFLGMDWLDGSRHARIRELVGARSDWDLDGMLRVQTDRKTVFWPRLRDPILDALRGRTQARALHWLERWDGVVGADSVAASIFELFFSEMVVRVAKAKAPHSWRAALGEGTNVVLPHGMMALRRLEHSVRLLVEQPAGFFARGWPAEMDAAMSAAMSTLRREAGPDETRWSWGRVRPVVLVHPVGTKKPLDRIWNRGPLAFGGDATTIPQASLAFDAPLGNPIGIPNLRAVMDVGNWDANRYVLAGGQSGNPLSPHYDDMIALWLRGDSVPMAWSPDAVRRSARKILTLEPGRPLSKRRRLRQRIASLARRARGSET